MSENEMKKKMLEIKGQNQRKDIKRNTSDLSHRGTYQKPKEQQKVNHIT